MNGIRHTKTSPYNSSTNGLAERYVREFKTSLRKNSGKNGLETNLERFLLAQRAFPQTVMKESPVELLMKRRLKTRFSNLMPKLEFKGEVFHDALKKQGNFNIGSDVYFRNYAAGPKWKLGTILKLLSCSHYLIGYEDQSFKRHINQLRPVKEKPEATALKDPSAVKSLKRDAEIIHVSTQSQYRIIVQQFVVEDSQVSLILTCKTSKQIWASLTKRYEGDIKKKSIEARNNVSRLRMYPEESWKDCLHRSEKLLENARIMGATIDDEEFIYSTFVFNMSSSKPSGSKTKRKIADEHRNFQEKWELEYFCSEVKDKIICLICNNAISVPKLYNIKRYYEQHKSKYDTYEGLMRQEKLKEFKLGMKKQQFMFTKVSQESEAAVHASYVLSEMIDKHSKPFTEGDFIKECLVKAAEIVCPGSVKTFQAISLSRNTVVERVTDKARNLNDQIKEKSSCFEAFSIAYDESTDIGGVAQLAVFFSSLRHGFQHF
ncbi:hypothetical protein LAZ67_8000729 [Cordylochernes scorpioides]|uniref:SPIN-DOC-like zinc-finger domain-containing protein n=1 Tax=Cordylochernes scorpioides TaxID=51811 RepID=A0ABY6KPQ6_9ARAC|nr:hypothetical protein LAZ67_8000729 [Cordylochernes scorpioides]